MTVSMSPVTSNKEMLTIVCDNITHTSMENSGIIADLHRPQSALDPCHNP